MPIAINKNTIRADPPVSPARTIPGTLSLSVSSSLHMRTHIFHVNFYVLAAN
jgi:hypothetical protein